MGTTDSVNKIYLFAIDLNVDYHLLVNVGVADNRAEFVERDLAILVLIGE